MLLFSKFGFPLDVKPRSRFEQDLVNHPFGKNYPTCIKHYLEEELNHKAILVSFETPPDTLHISPFMLREKSDLDKKKLIVDLRLPKGTSINDVVAAKRK